jgi:hypothetical protein
MTTAAAERTNMASDSERKIEFVDPRTLNDHPLNHEIYGDVPDEEFVARIRDKGIKVPLQVLADRTVVDGHRRKQAALACGMDLVPIVIRGDLTDPLEIEEFLLDCNDQREKTTEQRAREYQRYKALAAEKAKQRQRTHGNTAPGRKKGDPEEATSEAEQHLGKIFPECSATVGRASDAAAQKVGMSTPTAEKASKVVEAIDEAAASGDVETATALREALNHQSVSAAARQARVDAPQRNASTSHTLAKRKNGGEVNFFDESRIDKPFGLLARAVDERAATYGGPGTHHAACLKSLQEFYREIVAWREVGFELANADPDEAAEPQGPRDKKGALVPDRLRHIFATADDFNVADTALGAAQGALLRISRVLPDGAVNYQPIDDLFRQIHEHVQAAKPATVCAVCSGKGLACQACGRSGYLTVRQRSGKSPSATALLDALKRPVPEHLAEVFRTTPWFRKEINDLGQLRSQLEALSQLPAGARLDLQDCQTLIGNLQQQLKYATPHTECPSCRGKPSKLCKLCRGCDWIGRGELGGLTQEQKVWLGGGTLVVTEPDDARVTPEAKLAAAGHFDALQHRIMGMHELAIELAKIPGAEHLTDARLEEIRGKLANVNQVLETTRPYAVCGDCGGRGCKSCLESGVLPKQRAEACPTPSGSSQGVGD